jgi:hypothetical protein
LEAYGGRGETTAVIGSVGEEESELVTVARKFESQCEVSRSKQLVPGAVCAVRQCRRTEGTSEASVLETLKGSA